MRQPRSGARARRTRTGTSFIRVRLENISLTLLGRPILRGVNWDIAPGQRWLLLGANGAGKTLLLKLLAGDVWPNAGRGRRRYWYRGARFEEPYGVKQHIAYIGAERQDRYEHYGWNQRVEAIVGTGLHRTEIPLDALSAGDRARVAALLQRLGLSALARRRFLSLSYGERRLVLLARALASAPKLLLLDELLNGLDARNRARAQRALALLSRSALPWVLTGHRAEELPEAVTHRCRLQGGRITAARAISPSDRKAAARRGLAVRSPGAAARSVRIARTHLARAASPPPSPSPLITLEHCTVWRAQGAALRGLSLVIRSGECWVVHGANGSGKSSLIQLLYGDLTCASSGVVRRAGVPRGTPIAEFKRRVGLVSPELQTLHPRYLSVAQVVASGDRASIGHEGRVAARARRRVQRVLRRLDIAALEHRRLGGLSYGQVRQVLFARALLHEPDILLLDEPYAGLDAPTRVRLHALVDQIIGAGVTVVITSHHGEDWPATPTHELELRRGRAHYCGPVRAAHDRP